MALPLAAGIWHLCRANKNSIGLYGPQKSCYIVLARSQRVPLYPGVLRDLQCHLVNAAAICVATDSDIERCFTNSP